MASMNVVPLIDILLVLLIIFMVITPLTPKGLEALVPQPAPPNQKNQDQIQAKTIVVQVLDNNQAEDQRGRRHLGYARAAAERHLQAARREGGLRQGRRHGRLLRRWREAIDIMRGSGHRQGGADHGQARSGPVDRGRVIRASSVQSR